MSSYKDWFNIVVVKERHSLLTFVASLSCFLPFLIPNMHPLFCETLPQLSVASVSVSHTLTCSDSHLKLP